MPLSLAHLWIYLFNFKIALPHPVLISSVHARPRGMRVNSQWERLHPRLFHGKLVGRRFVRHRTRLHERMTLNAHSFNFGWDYCGLLCTVVPIFSSTSTIRCGTSSVQKVLLSWKRFERVRLFSTLSENSPPRRFRFYCALISMAQVHNIRRVWNADTGPLSLRMTLSTHEAAILSATLAIILTFTVSRLLPMLYTIFYHSFLHRHTKTIVDDQVN